MLVVVADAQLCGRLALCVHEAIGGATELDAREDSRAFGAMLEARVADAWPEICAEIGAEVQPRPGRRTIYDLAFRRSGVLVGVDLKTTDLDAGRYSDGGICAVGNLLRFLVNEGAVFLLAEIAHRGAPSASRRVTSVRVAPLHLMPTACLRIENLGTGQVRLDGTMRDAWADIDWDRTLEQFLAEFTTLAIQHYTRVAGVAQQRVRMLEEFRDAGFKKVRLK